MSNNLKKFDSTAAYVAFRSRDGWDYPAVHVVQAGNVQETHYNNEFRMRWYDDDVAKYPRFYGDVSRDQFRDWVDNASRPCEIHKSGGSVNSEPVILYYALNAGTTSVNSWQYLNDGTSSHYGSTDYLEMTEIDNINVGLFENKSEGWKEVRFNFDRGCPSGFHKWFPNSRTGTKLWARYDSIPVDTVSTVSTYGINVAPFQSMGSYNSSAGEYNKGIWSADTLLAGMKAMSLPLLEETYWEHLVLTYIYCAFFGTFDTQSIYRGRTSGSQAQSMAIDTGSTDYRYDHYGELAFNESGMNSYRFLHIEDAIHGKAMLWAAGAAVDNKNKVYYMTYDDIKANTFSSTTASFNRDYTDVSGFICALTTTTSKCYMKNIDLFGMPTETSGTSDTGFYDFAFGNTTQTNGIMNVGGDTYYGYASGGFARFVNANSTSSYWDRRGRVTLNR